MSELEQNDLAWRAFFLGARAAIDAYSVVVTDSNRDSFIRTVEAIAEGEFTLADPEVFAKTTDPKQRAVFASMSHGVIDTEKQLAVMIREGFNNVCDTAV